jgi:hypothetical protein
MCSVEVGRQEETSGDDEQGENGEGRFLHCSRRSLIIREALSSMLITG